ncbi:MAG TPA: hypothetical protein VG963_11355 [Polyangiaceae bacterium]|nr:hypothetical protein [Polyangiaceae bacterium]
MLPPGSWRSVLGISLALGMLSSSVAGAEASGEPSHQSVPSSPLDLTWVSQDPTCDGGAVAARALELVPRSVSPAPLDARAELSRSGSDWIVELTTRGENTAGRRVLRGSSCQEIQQAIALLLAMILEAESKSAPPPPEPKTPSPPPPVQSPSPAWQEPPPASIDVPEQHTATERGESLEWLLRIEGSSGLGWQPGLRFGTGWNRGIGLGFGAAASAVWKGWELGLSGAYWPVTSSKAFDGRAALQMSRGELGLLGCRVLWQGSRVGLAPCLGGGVSIVPWRSIGLDVSGQDTVWFGVLNAYLDLRVRLSGWLFLLASPGVAWERPQAFGTHVSDNCTNCVRATLFQAWAVEPRLKLGVGASF